ncbi:MAG: HD domain-containing protein [Candidatus Thorarchaeota archaeon]|jgi:HD superfamily phosphohydrolase
MSSIVDPLHGIIKIPQWLLKLLPRPEIYRMINIRQLGLKAYVDFPGAIHTRYIHSLGTMHVANRLRQSLLEKGTTPDQTALKENLENNGPAIMAAGFLHDTGHGPFSHVLDYVIEQKMDSNHADLSLEVVSLCEDVLERENISVDHVCKMINESGANQEPSQYPFLQQIIDGPLDADKMDYLLRDAFNVGLNYGFDLNHLLDQVCVLGEGEDLDGYQIGLADTKDAVVVAEHFLLTWRSMYSLVYFSQNTRIAEKMLEKAVFIGCDEDPNFNQHMTDSNLFLQLEETPMLKMLRDIGGLSSELVEAILSRKYYQKVVEIDLNYDYLPDTPFMIALMKNSNQVADVLSKQINDELKTEHSYICDIVVGKTPRNIRINRFEEGEPMELVERSHIVKAMSEAECTLYVYVQPTLMGKKPSLETKIDNIVKKLIEDWD